MFIIGLITGFITGVLSFMVLYFGAVVKDALERKPLGQRIGA